MGSSAGSELRSRTHDGEAQAFTFGDAGKEHQGTTHDKVGQNRCDVVSRWPASGRWSSGSITCFGLLRFLMKFWLGDPLFIGLRVDDLVHV
jgi:hypothetical protein